VQRMYQYKPESEVHDRLVFTHSELSPHYYSSARFRAGIFQREPEPITKGRPYEVYFHGTGRYNFFRIIRPSPHLRVMVDFSCTDLGPGRSRLPSRAVVLGEENYPIPFIGHGSARVVTPIVKPEYFEQEAYLTLDFHERPYPIAKPRTGLMRLYGANVSLDDRRLIGFTRDVSVLTDEQYQHLPRPVKIGDFPDDLARYPGLEYSGFYEDGWIAEDSFLKLGASRVGQMFTFRGYIPDIARFRAQGLDLTLVLNGRPTGAMHLTPGEFIVRRLITEPAAITAVSLHFSDAEIYGAGGDQRPVSAFVREFSVGDIPDITSFQGLAKQEGDKFIFEGVDPDGWIGRSAQFRLPAFSDYKVLKIDVENPGWSPRTSDRIDILLDGRVVQTETVPKETDQSLYVRLAPGANRTVRLDSSAIFQLPGEARARSLLIKKISFESLSPIDFQ
jgi:hypothetical protein